MSYEAAYHELVQTRGYIVFGSNWTFRRGEKFIFPHPSMESIPGQPWIVIAETDHADLIAQGQIFKKHGFGFELNWHPNHFYRVVTD